MEQLQLADCAAAAAVSAHNAATIYVRGTESLCMLQAASWLAMMQQQQHAADPLSGTVVGLQQGAVQLELLVVRSSCPAVDGTGEHIPLSSCVCSYISCRCHSSVFCSCPASLEMKFIRICCVSKCCEENQQGRRLSAHSATYIQQHVCCV
jgi:hypothetical protein